MQITRGEVTDMINHVLAYLTDEEITYPELSYAHELSQQLLDEIESVFDE